MLKLLQHGTQTGHCCHRRAVVLRGLMGLVGATRAGAACALMVAGEPAAAGTGIDTGRVHTVDEHVWWIQGHPDVDSDPRNAGHVSNILLVREDRRLWILGTGATPEFGAALLRTCTRRWPGLELRIVSTWAHPESVLGAVAFDGQAGAHWAHEEVAQQMVARCPSCAERMAKRLGIPASGLTIRIPQRTVRGDHGRLGPLRWWRLQRAGDSTVLVWFHERSGLAFAPGLLWGDAPPDGRDADCADLTRSLAALRDTPIGSGAARWLGQQGGIGGPDRVAAAAAYWEGLQRAALQGQDRGDDGLQAPRVLPQVPPSWLEHPLHALNWQRAWRQAESLWLQRSLR